MNLTPYQKKQLKLVLVLLIGIPFSIFAVYKGVQYITMAGADSTPKEVVITNISTNSFTVTWVTEKEVEGYVVPISNGAEQSPVADKRGSGKRTSHYVELKSLEPATEYSFLLLSDGDKYKDEQGEEYKFSTAPIGETMPIPSYAMGSVTGSKLENTIVYIMFTDKSVYPLSVDVSSSGTWMISLSSLRKISDKSLVRTTDETELVVMAKEGVSRGLVLQGTFSAMFDSKGELNQPLILEDVEAGKLLSYFPDSAIPDKGGQGGNVVPQEQPEEEVVEEEVEQPEEPTLPYPITQDIVWENLVSGSGSLNLETGEDTVIITNLTDTNFVVSWRSAEKEEGYIKYGTSKEELNSEMRDSRDTVSIKGKYYSHYIESGRLDPETTYYFEIYSGGKKYDNDGEKYTVETLSLLSSPPALETRSGKIVNAPDPSDWVLIFQMIDNDEAGTVGKSQYISTLPEADGSWTLVVGDARSEDGSKYFSFSNSDILSASFLGTYSETLDFNLSENDIELDINEVILGTVGKVTLLDDYGIVKLE